MDAFILFGILSSVLPLALLVLVIIAVLGGRYEDDPRRERPRAVYLSAACFVSLIALVAAVFVAVTSLLGLSTDSDSFASASFSRSVTASAQGSMTVDEEGNVVSEQPSRVQLFEDDEQDESRFEEASIDDFEYNQDISSAVMAGIVALLAAGILWFHDPRLRHLAAARGPAARVYVKFLYLVCFVSVVVLLGSAAAALYSLYSAAAPGVADVSSRSDGFRGFTSAVSLVVFTGLVFSIHWRRADAMTVGHVTEPGFAPTSTPSAPPAPPAPETAATPEPPTPPATRGRIVRRTRPDDE